MRFLKVCIVVIALSVSTAAVRRPQWTAQFYKAFTGAPSHRHLISYDPIDAMIELRAYEGDQMSLVTFCRYGDLRCHRKEFWRDTRRGE